MKTIILSILFTMLFVPTISASPKNIDELGIKGIDLVFDMQFEQANKIFDEMIRMDPENAIGYFLKSKSYLWMTIFSANDDKEHIENFLELSFKTIDIAKGMLDKNEDNIDALFYMGNAYGYIGRWDGKTGHWIKAFWYGRKGTNYLKKVIEKDPDYYDAYLGLGMYHYYVDVLPKYIKALSFLLGLGGDSEKGIDEVILASSKGNLTRGEAKFLLASEIYLTYEKNYEKALPLLKELTTNYPHNHAFKYSLAGSYQNLYKYNLSVKTIEKALQSESLNEYPYLCSQIYYSLGETYSQMNEFDQAILAYKNAYKILQSEKGNKSWVYSWALFFIGFDYEMMGSIDKAHEYYSQIKERDNEGAYKYALAMIKNPLTHAQINLAKGKNYLRCEKYTQSETILKELINTELSKESVDSTFKAETCLYLGEVEYHLKEYHDSIQTLNKVFSFSDINNESIKPRAHLYLGNCYRELSDIEKAEKEYEIAYKYNDNELRSEIDKVRSKMKSAASR